MPMPHLRLPEQCLLAQGSDLASVQPVIEQLHARFTWAPLTGARRRNNGNTVHVHAAQSGALALSMLTYGDCYDIRPEHLGQAVLATTVLDGRMAQSTRTGTCVAQVGDTVLAADADSPCFGYEERTEVLKLRLPQAHIDTLCWQLLGHAGTTSVRFAQASLQGHGVGGWLSLLSYLVQSVQAQASGSLPWFGGKLEECFILHLLQNVPHNYSDALNQEASGHLTLSRTHRRARAYIEAHWQDPLTLADIAAAACCSPRSLTRVFQQAENITPMQYLQELRLQRVRIELSTNGEARETVAAIAMRCGFSHLGEFNRQYRRRFGEPPSAARMRLPT